MENVARSLGAKGLRRLGRAVSGDVQWPQPSTMTTLKRRAFERSAAMIEDRIEGTSLFDDRTAYLRFVAGQLVGVPSGLFLEFGYYLGVTAKVFVAELAKRQDRPVLHAFDAFQGLRDPWTEVNISSGAFGLDGVVPDPQPGVEFVVGWVEDTLGPFLESHSGPLAFANFDMDVYPPTRVALEQVAPRLVTGSILTFDDLHGFPGWERSSWRAIGEVLDEDRCEWIAFGPFEGALRIR